MKLFFIADIHGSLFFLEKAIEAYKREQAGYIAILGDELYHGARNPLPQGYDPVGVTKLLNEYANQIIAVRGNCDSEVDELVLEYPIMSTYSIILHENRRLFLTHGHVYNEGNMPKLLKGDVFLYGHTHVPRTKKSGDIYIVNPGSITSPKENSPNSYAVLENSTFYIKDLEGNVFKTLEME